MFFSSKALDFLGGVSNEQFSTSGSYVTPTVFLEHLQLFRMFAEPLQIANGLLEQSRQLRVIRKLFDNYRRPPDWRLDKLLPMFALIHQLPQPDSVG